MDIQLVSVAIGSGITLTVGLIPLLVNGRRESRRAKAEARAHTVQALENLLRDAQEVRFNLGTLQHQWNSWRAVGPQIAYSLTHALGGYKRGEPFAGLADGFKVAVQWRQSSTDAHSALLIVPLQRLGASVAHLASFTDPRVREVGERAALAVGGLAQVAQYRPGNAKRVAAEAEYDAAVIRLGEVMRDIAEPGRRLRAPRRLRSARPPERSSVSPRPGLPRRLGPGTPPPPP